MARLVILPPAAKFLKKIKDANVLKLFQNAIEEILSDPTVGTAKTGDLKDIYGYDISYKKINYELAYTIQYIDDTVIVIIMAGTRENFYDQLKRYVK
jgi:mRNA interferase RelE/StbE